MGQIYSEGIGYTDRGLGHFHGRALVKCRHAICFIYDRDRA